MEKSLIINVMVDNVKLSDLEKLQEALEEVFSEYRDKRITVSMQDEKVVRFG